MANHKSAIKKNRQDAVRRVRNRRNAARLRTQVKKLRLAIAAGEADTARGMLRETLSLVDRSAKLGVLHENAAARTKSRLERAVNGLDAAAS